MKIFINEKFYTEKKYILDELFSRQMKINYSLHLYNEPDYTLRFDNGHSIIIKDSFFEEVIGSNYLKKNYLPKKATFISYDKIKQNIVSLYGGENVYEKDNLTYIEFDLFASSFFMLTRWEEFISQNKDRHGRFSLYDSIAYKFNFYKRPIVNEHIEFLKELLVLKQKSIHFRENNFEIISTHDIDHVNLWQRKNALLFYTLKSLLKEKSIKTLLHYWKNYFEVKVLKKKLDSYDTFDLFMNLSEENNIKSHFYFLLSDKSKYDSNNKIKYSKIESIIDNIEKRGHIVGIHPSYSSINDLELWRNEVQKLRGLSNNEIVEGRQHYLRIEIPKTLRIWEKNKLQYDSTLGFVEDIGFRCGICNEFTFFDIEKGKEMNIKELPLIIMDVTLKTYMKDENIENELKNIVGQVKKYNGKLVVLWHNNNVYGEWSKYFTFYKNIIRGTYE